MARQAINIDWEQFESLIHDNKTLDEIRKAIGVSETVLRKKCRENYDAQLKDVYKAIKLKQPIIKTVNQKKNPELQLISSNVSSIKEPLWKQAEAFARCGAPKKDIAWLFNMSIDELSKECLKVNGCSIDEFVDRNNAIFRNTIRMKQLELVNLRNAQMIVHLGKTVLGQNDNNDTSLFDDIPDKLEITIKQPDKKPNEKS